MIDKINKTTFIRNLIVSLFFGIIVPLFLVFFIDKNQRIFNLELMISCGIIYVIIYSGFGLFEKDTFIRFAIGFGYILGLLYFYQVGSNIFTLYLPHCEFGTICVDGTLLDFKLSFSLNYVWMIILLLSLKGLNLFRHYIKPVEDKDGDDWAEDVRKTTKK
ncbi:MAG: hypothetical protein ACFFDB_00325 [Promethearchaeota archaeon]